MIYMWKHALEPVGTDVTLAMVGSPCSGGEHCEIEENFLQRHSDRTGQRKGSSQDPCIDIYLTEYIVEDSLISPSVTGTSIFTDTYVARTSLKPFMPLNAPIGEQT